jgi:hypothetical protein
MKLKKEFLLHSTEKETVLVPTGAADFSGIVRGNRTLGDVLELLGSETTEEEIVSALRERYDAPEGAIERDVSTVLEKLRSIGALEE